jgi:hypothetical protein
MPACRSESLQSVTADAPWGPPRGCPEVPLAFYRETRQLGPGFRGERKMAPRRPDTGTADLLSYSTSGSSARLLDGFCPEGRPACCWGPRSRVPQGTKPCNYCVLPTQKAMWGGSCALRVRPAFAAANRNRGPIKAAEAQSRGRRTESGSSCFWRHGS